MQKRFRKATDATAAEVWVDVGFLRYRIELYEDGELAGNRKGFLSRQQYTEALLSGDNVAALVRIQPDRTVQCTWAR